MIDPKMMAQLGGAGNLMNMMKEMNGNPEMQKMMGGMGMGNLEGLAKKKFVKVKKWSTIISTTYYHHNLY